MRIVVTTVHGTYARKAKWPRLDSPLGRYLRRHLPGDVEVAPFRWSGRNSFRKREEAARDLRAELLIRTAEPDTKHFVIAHSHGGNVALLAAGDPVLQERLAGIVCLATPFLQAWPRPLGTARVISAGAGAAITLANAAYFLLRGFVDANTAVLIGIAIFGLVNVVAMRLALWLSNARRVTWALPDFDSRRLMILRAAGDEASALLGAATLVAYVVTRLWSVTAQGAQLYGRSVEDEQSRNGQSRRPPPFGYSKWAITYYAVTFVLMVLGPILCAVSLLPAARAWITPLQATGVLVAGWMLWLPLVWRRVFGTILLFPIWWISCILIGPVLLVLAIVALLFGPSLAFMHLFWEVSAEPTPPGRWLMKQLNPSTDPADDPVLMHSTLYDDPRAHSDIAKWITGMLARASASAAV